MPFHKKTFPENFCNMEIGLIVKRGLVDRFLIRHQSATITCKWKTDQAGPTKQDSFMYKWSQNEKSLPRLRDRIWIFDSSSAWGWNLKFPFLGLTPGLPKFPDNFPNSRLPFEFLFTLQIVVYFPNFGQKWTRHGVPRFPLFPTIVFWSLFGQTSESISEFRKFWK